MGLLFGSLLAGISLTLLVVIFIVRSRGKHHPAPQPPPKPPESPVRIWVRALTREPDALADLVRYVHFAEVGEADPAKGPEVVKRFLSELYAREEGKNSEVRWLKNLSREQDPVAKLADYVARVESGQLDARIGPRIVKDFLRDLSALGRICEVGPFNAVVPFDPRVHRGIRDGNSGELVRITRPGWMVDGEIIKYPMVQRERRAS